MVYYSKQGSDSFTSFYPYGITSRLVVCRGIKMQILYVNEERKIYKMWNLKIAGVEFYHIINWFYIYSFLGWLWESCYVSVKNKKIVNRGFVTGPFCTIYGCGAVLVYLCLLPVSDKPILIYFGGAIVASVIEYVTAAIMETLFHTTWWDYSKQPLNLKGRICLTVSLGWGVFSLVLFKILQPLISGVVELYPVNVGKIAVVIITVIYIIDLTNSTIVSLKLKNKLASLDEIANEITQYYQTTKLYETTEDLKNKLGYYRSIIFDRLENDSKDEKRMTLLQRLEEVGESESFTEISEKLAEYNAKVKKMRGKLDFVTKRYIRSYPKLGNLSNLHKEKRDRKEKEDADSN